MGLKEEKYGIRAQSHLYFAKKLNTLGIGKAYMGYYYLIDIMDILINKNQPIKSFSGQVYPVVAEIYGKGSCTIERDIRDIINSLWSIKLKDELTMFWDKERKPRCCEFIYILKNYIIKDLI